jgi:hypothetical protein
MEELEVGLTGDRFDFQHRTQVLLDSRCLQLSASIAGTVETCAIGETHVATPFANEPSVQTRRHGPELNAEHAIGTTNNFLGHKKS